MFKEVNKFCQKIFETTQPSGFLWIASGFHRPKTMLSHSMICWAKSSAQPTTPAASTGAAGTTYQGYKTWKLAMYEFHWSSKRHNQWCSNLTNSNIKTHRGWEFHLPTQPVCMLLLHLLLQKINCCTTDPASLHRHIWCSEIYWNTEMEAATSPVKHSTSQVVTPRALLQLVSRFCWRNKWTEQVRGGFSMFAAWCCKSRPTVGVTHDNGLNLAYSTNDANHWRFGLIILICRCVLDVCYTDIQS